MKLLHGFFLKSGLGRSVLLAEAIIFGIVGGIGLLSGWNSVREYTDALRAAGIVTILIGALSLYGGFESSRSLTYMTGAMSLPEESRKTRHRQLYSCFILCAIAGGVAVLLSLLGFVL
jgi:hypothetical protein